MLDDALERNTETLKEKEQQEKMLKEIKLTLQAFERKNTELQVFYNEVKEKKKELEKHPQRCRVGSKTW